MESLSRVADDKKIGRNKRRDFAWRSLLTDSRNCAGSLGETPKNDAIMRYFLVVTFSYLTRWPDHS